MKSQDESVLEEQAGRVLTITLNRPEAKNAITSELNVALHASLIRAAENPSVGAIVITGAGGAFCVGGDVKSMAKNKSEKPRYSTEQLLAMGAEAALMLHRMPKPTIAMISGAAAGGGLSLALGCDLRFAAPSAKLTFAYTRIGLSGDFAGTYLLQHWLGAAKAREFCLLCPVLDGQQALELGLLNGVYNEAELKTHVYTLAEKLANGPTRAIGRIKENLNNAIELPLEEYVRRESENFVACRDSDEHKEALRAFIEKHAPDFPR